jgi:aspartate-semialdehyde dehydrogenase
MKDKDIEKNDLNRLLVDDETPPVRINVHPTLEDEFKYWREKFEDLAGYKIEGGKPVISKICAHILKELRTKSAREEKKIIIEVRKVIGLKRVKIVFL